MRRGVLVFAALTLTACAKSPLLEQQIQTSYAEAAALDTLHDYEVARLAAAAQLSRLEGLIAQERRDPELLALAARGWCRHAFYVAWDDREIAEELGDGSAALYHAERTLAGFERSAYYARELVEQWAPGYNADDPQKLDGFLRANFVEAEEAPVLMWAGCAELGRAFTETDAGRAGKARLAATTLLEHSLALDDSAGDGFAELMLAAATALEPGASRDAIAAHLDRARRQSKKRLLLVEVAQAMFVDCRAGDEAALVSHLSAVLDAGDVAPEHRLDNLVAKRRARRYLESATWRAKCSATPPTASTPPAATPPTGAP
jgi:hypothetical protein